MIPVSYGGNAINDGTNYVSLIELDGYGLPQVGAAMGERTGNWPLFGAVDRKDRRITLQVFIRGASVDTLRKQLYQYFDYENETPKQFIVSDSPSGNNRYIYAVCQGVFPDALQPKTCYYVALVVHGDVRWREVTPTTDTWAITASGQTKALTNNGQDGAYPILKIKPTSAKTGGYTYKRFMTVRWRSSLPITRYPVDITNDSLDTAALVSGGKMQADGDDLRVFVDGVEVDRWLDGINTTTTKVWCLLDFAAKVEVLLASNIGAGDVIIPIAAVASQDITAFPASGILLIGSELITYTGVSVGLQQFTGCTRGAKGSTAAAHTAGDAVIWVQHDIWILYGNSSAASPPADATIQPMFSLATSTNTSWDYDNFRDDGNPNRAMDWQKGYLGGSPTFYGGNQGTTANPYVELGVSCQDFGAGNPEARFTRSNPCGITNVNFANGEKYTSNRTAWVNGVAVVQSHLSGAWVDEYYIPTPTANSTWQSWSYSAALSQTATTVGLYLKQIWYPHVNKVEAADVTLTLDSSATPSITVGAEQGNYSLACRITNNTTGVSLLLTFSMALNQQLELDTDAKTIIYLLDNSPQMTALTMAVRRDWLRLQPGSNTIQFDDTGTNGVTIDFEWEERHYQ